MADPDSDNYLAWSKTIDGVRVRAFAFTEGCSNPDCDACMSLEAEPVWAVFTQPRPEEDAARRDEWCLTALMWGNPDDETLTRFMVEGMSITDDEVQAKQRKLAALMGVPWAEVVRAPYHLAATQHHALEEFTGQGLLAGIINEADEEQLRELRTSWRSGQGESFGAAFGRLWWSLVQATRRRHRGS